MSATEMLDRLAKQRPEWMPWLDVVRGVVVELADDRWASGLPQVPPARDGAPLLARLAHGPDACAVRRLMENLACLARTSGMPAMRAAQRLAMTDEAALAVFHAALNEDDAALDARAAEAGMTPEGFRALAGLLPMPFLHACTRRWSSAVRSTWSEGYCPVCGAWPAFAEVRGVERSRHLRCGRCGSGWPMPVLSCPYCGTTDHGKLGSLVVDAAASRFAVDVCHRCLGYLKTCTTLQPTQPAEVIATDLASVEFDLAAAERGYCRPPGSGYALRVSLADGCAPPTLHDA